VPTRILVSRISRPVLLLAGLIVLAGGAYLLSQRGEAEPSDEEAIREVVAAHFTESEPEHCETLYTEQYLARFHFGTGAVALAKCKEEADDKEQPNWQPDEVATERIAIDEYRATAKTDVHGGAFDGSRFTIVVAREGGMWKIDGYRAVDLNPGPLRAFFTNEFDRAYGRYGLSETEADCVTATYQRAFDFVEMERNLVRGEEPVEPDFPRHCLTADTLRSLIVEGVKERRREGESTLPRTLSACFVGAVRRLSDAGVQSLFDENGADQAAVAAVMAPCIEAEQRRRQS
jgi:hypothetical protein